MTSPFIPLVDSQITALCERFGWTPEGCQSHLRAKEGRGKNGLILVSGGDAKTTCPVEYRRRGILMRRDKILAEGSLIPTEIVASSVSKVVRDGVEILSVVSDEETLDFPDPKVTPYLSGVYLTLTYDPTEPDGVIISTNTNPDIRGTSAKWDVQSHVTFEMMLAQTGFPPEKDLIEMAQNEPFHLKVHVFHSELSLVTRQNAQSYAAVVDCDNAALELGLRMRCGLTSDIVAEVPEPKVFSMPKFSVDDAVDFFNEGWWGLDSKACPQLGTSESIMIDIGTAMYRIVSVGWEFRSKVRGAGANLWYEFVAGLERTFKPGFLESLRVPARSEEELTELVPLVYLDPDDSYTTSEALEKKLQRYHTAFVFSVAPPLQKTAVRFLTLYQGKRVAVRDLLFDLEKDFMKGRKLHEIREHEEELSEAIERLAVNSRQARLGPTVTLRENTDKEVNARHRCTNMVITAVESALKSRASSKSSFNIAWGIKNNLGKFLGKERGRSFYNLLRYFGLNGV